MPTDEEVVETASDAAEGVIFSHYKRSAVRDLDVTVSFAEGVLDLDVYLDAPDGSDDPDPEVVVEEAVLAAESAVDDLFTNAE